ncbi:hypothetical protein BJV74DRAFT_943416 [Russula compacta]|nr:hypothetical protein BJV74DRAFT_943416 [Russula compacta]
MADNQKLSLQAFLLVLTSKNLPISRAMTVASKIYKDFNTPARLGELTDSKLLSLGVSDKEDRRLVLSALNAAGYRTIAVANAKQQRVKKQRAANEAPRTDDDDDGGISVSPPKNGEPSTAKRGPPSPAPFSSPPSPHKKRRRGGTLLSPSHFDNEFLPSPAPDEGVMLGSLDFHELLDEDTLRHKSTIVNRAPVMMAWACVVAERLGFLREEALSIASAYTEINAISKGVSQGIYNRQREADLKAAHAGGGAQPYVDLLGRRIPLYRTASGSWRAFTTEDSNGNSSPGGGGAAPGAAYSYITRALRQTAPAVLGAMRLLAESYDDPMELNNVGFALYADFRPDVNRWGKRGDLKCETLLGLRKKRPKGEPGLDGESNRAGMAEDSGQGLVKHEAANEELTRSVPDDVSDEPPTDKVSKLEPNDLLDASFDEFTAEELSVLP